MQTFGSIFEKAPHVIAIRGILSREGDDGSYDKLQELISREAGEFILDFDCHGGDAIGVLACARAIAATKRAHAYVSGVCASAAYFLASACEDITCAEDARVGSIGAMCVAPDLPQGYKNSKYSPRKNMPDSQLDVLLDADAESFLRFVGERRNFLTEDLEEIAHLCGDGEIMTAKAALDRGLVDFVEFFSTDGVKMLEKAEQNKQNEQNPQEVASNPQLPAAEFASVVASAVQAAIAPFVAQLSEISSKISQKEEKETQKAEISNKVEEKSDERVEELMAIDQRLAALEAKASVALESRISSAAKIQTNEEKLTPIQMCKALAKEKNITFTSAVQQFLGGNSNK